MPVAGARAHKALLGNHHRHRVVGDHLLDHRFFGGFNKRSALVPEGLHGFLGFLGNQAFQNLFIAQNFLEFGLLGFKRLDFFVDALVLEVCDLS